MVHYLLESEVELYGGVEQQGIEHHHTNPNKHVGFLASFFWALKWCTVVAALFAVVVFGSPSIIALAVSFLTSHIQLPPFGCIGT